MVLRATGKAGSPSALTFLADSRTGRLRRRELPPADLGGRTLADKPELHDWKPLVEDLAQRRERAQGMGGPERIERQRSLGKEPVRARIDELLDPGTFVEYG